MNLMQELNQYAIYLISQSPRRQQLLKDMRVKFTCCSSNVAEVHPSHLSPVEVAEYIANLKFSSLSSADYPSNALFIACDTIVVLENQIIGKPKNREEAKVILQKLSNRTHTVISGLVVGTRQKRIIKNTHTDVTFTIISDAEIDYYIDHYAPLDKAGAYGIQEWIGHIGIIAIDGPYYNVMGLPTQLLWESFKEICKIEDFL